MINLTRIIRFVRHWHARIGVLAALFFLLLALTGLALNHTGQLGLDKREVRTAWLMHWYGLKASIPDHGYLFKDGYLAASEGRWAMDGHMLSDSGPVLAGAVSWGDIRAIASTSMLYLYADGQLVDKLSGAALPGEPIERIGISGTMLVLTTAQGDFVTADGLDWQPLKAGDVIWSNPQVLPASLKGSLRQVFAPALPLERVVLDIHSGRLFGHYGPLVMDLAALILVLLSLSGLWIYWRSIRKKPKP